MAVPKIKGIIPIGIQDNSSNIIDLLNRISQSAGAGYQSGQNLGLNFLNLLGRQKTTERGGGIEKLTTQLNTLEREETGIQKRITDLEKNITNLESQKVVPDIPEIMSPEYRKPILGYPRKDITSEELRKRRITELAQTTFQKPVPESRIISELEKNKKINMQVSVIKKQVNDLATKELKKIQGQKNFIKQKLGLLKNNANENSDPLGLLNE